jgi:hypothetical protein
MADIQGGIPLIRALARKPAGWILMTNLDPTEKFGNLCAGDFENLIVMYRSIQNFTIPTPGI